MLPGKKSNYYLIVAQVGPGDLKRLPLAALSVPAGNRFSGIDSHGESSKPFGHFEFFLLLIPLLMKCPPHAGIGAGLFVLPRTSIDFQFLYKTPPCLGG